MKEIELSPNSMFRIVVCTKCGSLYDIHYIDDVKIRKNTITHFKCVHCGMVPVVGKMWKEVEQNEGKQGR